MRARTSVCVCACVCLAVCLSILFYGKTSSNHRLNCGFFFYSLFGTYILRASKSTLSHKQILCAAFEWWCEIEWDRTCGIWFAFSIVWECSARRWFFWQMVHRNIEHQKYCHLKWVILRANATYVLIFLWYSSNRMIKSDWMIFDKKLELRPATTGEKKAGTNKIIPNIRAAKRTLAQCTSNTEVNKHRNVW